MQNKKAKKIFLDRLKGLINYQNIFNHQEQKVEFQNDGSRYFGQLMKKKNKEEAQTNNEATKIIYRLIRNQN